MNHYIFKKRTPFIGRQAKKINSLFFFLSFLPPPKKNDTSQDFLSQY